MRSTPFVVLNVCHSLLSKSKKQSNELISFSRQDIALPQCIQTTTEILTVDENTSARSVVGELDTTKPFIRISTREQGVHLLFRRSSNCWLLRSDINTAVVTIPVIAPFCFLIEMSPSHRSCRPSWRDFSLSLSLSSGEPFIRDRRLLGKISVCARKLYRDEQLDIACAGEKVRELIEEHVYSTGIDPKIPPVDLLAGNYEEVLNQHK